MQHGMSLKDASSYNVQFVQGKPIFIDTLSFERLQPTVPWKAYGQFCRHFLAPLALCAYQDVRTGKLLAHYLDGIEIDLASRMLPRRSHLKLGINLHIHSHAKSIQHAENRKKTINQLHVSEHSLFALIDNLRSTIQALRMRAPSTRWGEYYAHMNYSEVAFGSKKRIVREFLTNSKKDRLIDLAANDGEFSLIGSELGKFTLSPDFDPIAVEKNYVRLKKIKEKNILPLWIDFTNPSPSAGWISKERASFFERAGTDSVVLALALIHHLALGNNIPLPEISRAFSQIASELILEFVPKQDSQVREMLLMREDIFPDYHLDGLRNVLSGYFSIVEIKKIEDSGRCLLRCIRK